jgi:2C-methyl-D-erythritol 2,4-cyclodiphosphate synthase
MHNVSHSGLRLGLSSRIRTNTLTLANTDTTADTHSFAHTDTDADTHAHAVADSVSHPCAFGDLSD